MNPWLDVLLGVFFLFLGLGYLYRPAVIERINGFLRDVVLNDAYIALERKKWGIFFLLLSLFFSYVGYMALQAAP